MEPVFYSLQAVLRGVLILGLSLPLLAQIPVAPDASVFPLARKAPDFPVTAMSPALVPPPVFEFRGIRIGDEIKGAERKFLAWKMPSLSSNPGLCGSDGINRIETCTDVLESGEYVNMTILDRRVAQIYVSTNHRQQVDTYNAYVLGLAKKYGSPDKREIKYYHNGVQTGSSGERLRWWNGDQYLESSESERTIIIGSKVLDAEIAEQEHVYERN